jgi:hypothetical protein
MLFKDPLKELWVPFGLNLLAVFVNLFAASFSIWTGGWLWILNLSCAGFSGWISLKEYRKIPGRKADMQNRLLAQIRG